MNTDKQKGTYKAKRYQFSEEKKDALFAMTGGKCFYCGTKIENEEILDWGGKAVSTHHHWHVDHKLPISRGGTNDMDNLVPACVSCNGYKKTRTADEFIEQEQEYLQRRRG